jgi:hypothetical protein
VNHRRTRRAVVDASIGGEYGERWSDSIATTTTAAVATTLAATTNEDGATVPTPLPLSLEEVQSRPLFGSWKPPRYLWRALAAFIIAGQVVIRSITGRVHVRNTLQQLELIGPRSLGVSLLTASFVGMVFTIQFVREFARLGLTRSVGGVLSLALARELSPVVTAIIMAGRVGSAFAAELGTMQVPSAFLLSSWNNWCKVVVICCFLWMLLLPRGLHSIQVVGAPSLASSSMVLEDIFFVLR